MKIDQEGRMTIQHLSSKGVSNRQVARMLGVSEGSVRYHRPRNDHSTADGCDFNSRSALTPRCHLAIRLLVVIRPCFRLLAKFGLGNGGVDSS